MAKDDRRNRTNKNADGDIVEEKLIIQRNQDYTCFILNQPEKRNAVDFEMMEQLEKALDELVSSDDTKCLVITGAGKEAFCSGGDLSVFHALHTTAEARPMLRRMSRILFRIFTLEIPTIALLNGTAVGGGAEIASACDFRVAMPHGKAGFVQGKLAITTGWGGASLLMEQLPVNIVMEMVWSGAVYQASHMQQLGFVKKVFKTDNEREELATFVAPWKEIPVQVLSSYKRRKLDRIDLQNLKERIKREVEECAVLWSSEQHHKAVNTFLKKRK